MYRPRIVPVLLLNGDHLVKTVRFRDKTYIGDPMNAVRIFNDLKADELIFLDIAATREGRLISLDFVKAVGEEANMPFSVGGGIKSCDDIREIVNAGAEKVVINTLSENLSEVRKACEEFGSSTIAVCLDVKRNFWKKEKVYIKNGTEAIDSSPVDFAKQMEECGVGELIVQSIENDGVMKGYDIDLIDRVSRSVSIPIVALGGAGDIEHLKRLNSATHVNGFGCGSLFVFKGVHKGVLINYFTSSQKNDCVCR
jgi:cyclase